MDDDFRQRVGKPALILLGLLVGVAVLAFSISRVLLAVPEVIATISALAIAGYVLFVSALVGRQRRLSSQALGASLVIGFVAVVGAGVLAAQAGMRDLHADEHEAEAGEADEGEGQGEGEGDGEGEAAIPDDAAVWVAEDIQFTEAPDELPAGEVTIAIDNQGSLPHDVTFEDADVHVPADGGEQASDTFTLEPGTYTYFCSVPGHRQTMEGTVEVS